MAFDLKKLTSILRNSGTESTGGSTVVGVDLGASAVKLVQLRDVKGVPTLDTYGEIQLGPYEEIDIGRCARLSTQKTIQALVDILRESGATGKSVAFSLSYNASFTTLIEVSTIHQENIGTMVPIEARKYIPIALSKVHLDWFPTKVYPEKGSTDVLVSAVYNDVLTRYETILKGSGLTLVVNEVEIFSATRSVLTSKDTVAAVIDCGAASTRMHIVNNGVIEKTHSVLTSGASLTDILAKALKVEFSTAEEIKRNTGIITNEDERIQKALLGELNKGLRELHTVIKRYEEGTQTQVTKIVLTGSGALLQGLREYMQDMFSIPVIHADPFSKVAYPAFIEDTLKQAGPSFAVALGVALKAFQTKE